MTQVAVYQALVHLCTDIFRGEQTGSELPRDLLDLFTVLRHCATASDERRLAINTVHLCRMSYAHATPGAAQGTSMPTWKGLADSAGCLLRWLRSQSRAADLQGSQLAKDVLLYDLVVRLCEEKALQEAEAAKSAARETKSFGAASFVEHLSSSTIHPRNFN